MTTRAARHLAQRLAQSSEQEAPFTSQDTDAEGLGSLPAAGFDLCLPSVLSQARTRTTKRMRRKAGKPSLSHLHLACCLFYAGNQVKMPRM